jgi:hypothetical protein
MSVGHVLSHSRRAESAARRPLESTFASSTAGRFLIGSAVLALAGAGAITLFEPQSAAALWIITLVVPLCVIGCLAATGLAIENHPSAALTLLLVLPLLGGVYAAALPVLAGRGGGWAGLFTLVGLVLPLLALKRPKEA